MAIKRFPATAHARRLERQWLQIDDYRRQLLATYPIDDRDGVGGAAYRRWLELGEIQQHLDAAALRLERLTRIS